MGNSTVLERWWLVTFASFIVFLIFFLNHSPGNNNISVLQNLTMPITTSNQFATLPNMQQSPFMPQNEEQAISFNQFPMSRFQSNCIPLNQDLTDKSSSQIPNLSGLQNSKPSYLRRSIEPAATDSFQVPASGGLQNSKPLDFTDKAEPDASSKVFLPNLQNQNLRPADLSDNVEQAKASEATDKSEATTASFSQGPLLSADNQEPSKFNDNEEPIKMENGRKCNIFEGKWIYDPIESPLYVSAMCPFFSEIASCRRNGRPDMEYEKWRWEANDCKLPRFNAKDMLERLRGKRVVIVGDSINHGQFESLACLLYSAIPDQSYVDARARVFRAESYDLVIENHWAEFLVEVLLNKTNGKKALKLDSLVPIASKWNEADIMVFNTGHWWGSRKRWDFFQYKRKVFADMKIETAFKVAMKTWARWIERNVDTSKTTVYFRSISPAHFGNDWCYKSTRPIMDESYQVKFGNSVKLREIVEKTIRGMRTPVKYLNITKLSEYRPDAHSSIYASKQGKFLIATKQKRPELVADCSHWCLPGVPDTWNHLLYASMVLDSQILDLSSLQNSKSSYLSGNVEPAKDSSQVPESGFQNSKPPEDEKSSEVTDKSEATTSSSQGPNLLPVQNQEPPKFNGNEEQITMENGGKCNIFQGKWVYDPIESPLYDSAMCPFFSDIASCQRNGRSDKKYENWRWEANDCKIPRFNAKDMLERLRGKRVVIIGDSINHSQFESLACLLYSAIPDQSHVDARARIFRAEPYDLVIQNDWAQFLVELIVNKTDGKKTLKLDSLVPTASMWKDADILVFNSGHWWMTKRWDLVQYKRKVFEDKKSEAAFKVAMRTWARWIDRNIDSSKTKVYFRSMSPAHFGKDWCYKSTKPIMDESYRLKFGESLKEIVEKTIKGMRTPVKYLNITRLSDFRPDAHSSIYASKQGKLLVATKQKPPAMVADCSHWCLPGVPDTWNHLLYASMVLDSSNISSDT